MAENNKEIHDLQYYANQILNHEKQPVPSSYQPAARVDRADPGIPAKSNANKHRKEPGSGHRLLVRRLGGLLLLFIFLAGLILMGIKGWLVYREVEVIRGDLSDLEKLNISFSNLGTLEKVGPLLDKTHNDIETVRGQVNPWLGLGKAFGWFPVYGGDLKYSGDLLELGSDLTLAASQTYKTAFPIWQSVQANQGGLPAAVLTEELLKAQPAFSNSQVTLGKALQVRQRINNNELSPSTRALLGRIDVYLSSFNDGLSLASSLPTLFGSGEAGPKTYLILIQNEDELRPTGGFITAVGRVVVVDGRMINWDVSDSYSVDDINRAYPSAPWQLQSFMNVPIMTFHDSNWSPDFPTTVRWARYLYAYKNSTSLNGVIAIDQHVLKTLLSVTGPIYVGEINATVTADNVEQVMRMQKVHPAVDQLDPNWSRKQFMTPITGALLNKFSSGQGLSWEQLLKAITGELDQRHLLVDLDDPLLSKLLTERGWDNAVSRNDGDFLMAIDTNVGYNKTNAVVNSYLFYNVDLTDPIRPASNLAVVHHNSAQGPEDHCQQLSGVTDQSALENVYPIDRCYYDYLRVYLPAGTQLKSAVPHAVSHATMIMLSEDIPPRVDVLDDSLQGLQGFGTLLVTPMGQNVETDFKFNLPAGILTSDLKLRDLIYQLKVQKQAGTMATPIIVRVHLPQGSKIRSVSPEGSLTEGNNLLFNLVLSADVNIRIEFHL